MGAGQSAEDARNSSSSSTKDVKTSYYVLLGLPKQATDDEIKKAYRRKALELHPDRNYGNVEDSTRLFAEIQSAYEVLSDPQERAWYDSHEEAILRDLDEFDTSSTTKDGKKSTAAYERNVGLTTADDITRLFRKFHGGNVDFSDAPTGFFGFLDETFSQLAREEEAAARRDGGNEPDCPRFGHQADTHDKGVKQFYAAWGSFATAKSFAWRDRYRLSDAEDRRMRRLMEKENKRFRSEGMQEFNDAVRSLVAFVRKRDPRFKTNAQTEAERQQTLKDAAAKQAARMRARNEELMRQEIPQWAQSREAEPNDAEEGDLDADEESEEEQFECVACKKTFKSEKAFEAHEKSKKHVKAISSLKRQLEKEGKCLNLDNDVDGHDDLNDTATNGHDPRKQDDGSLDHAEVEGNFDDESLDRLNLNDNEDPHGEDDDPSATPNIDDEHLGPQDADGDLSASLNTNPQPNPSTSHSPSPSPPSPPTRTASEKTSTLSPSSSQETPRKPQKTGAAAKKRAKRAAAQQPTFSSTNSTTASDPSSSALDHKCVQCGAAFSSRSRLFRHLNDFGHLASVDAVRGQAGCGSAGRDKGKKKGK